MQALLHCPNVLVCVGREPFKPVLMENLRKHSGEKLPNLAPRSNSNNVNENNESKKNSRAYCTVVSRPVSHNMEITGTYCTAPMCRFHVENVLPSLCLPGLSILPFFFSGFLLGFPPYTLQSFFYMLPMSGWLPFLFHISVSPFPSRTPSFPVSASETPQTLEISHESSIPLSVCRMMLALCICLHQDKRMTTFCQQETQFLLQVTAAMQPVGNKACFYGKVVFRKEYVIDYSGWYFLGTSSWVIWSHM